MSEFKRYRDLAIVVLLLTVPFFVLRANLRNPENLNAVDRLVLRVTAPVEYWTASLARGFSHLLGDYFYLVDVKQENERLSYENARLREETHRLEAKGTENVELRRLLQLKEATAGDTLSALVVGTNFTEFFRVSRVVLDRGSRDVRPKMPVITPDGVVGVVLRVNGNAVDVQLATDAALTVDVEDVRTKARGLVRGTGDPKRYACRVEMVDARDEIEVGDLLVTSGKGKLFPRGIPVARVTSVVKRELGRDQEVEATPTVNFSRVDSVLILLSPQVEEAAPDPSAKPAAPVKPR